MSAILVVGAAKVCAQSTTIEAPASKDNTLYESATGAVSNGKGIHFFVGRTNGASRRRGVIAFDLSQIPAGAAIQSAALTLQVTRVPNNISREIALHRATADWGEGNSNAGSTADGDGAPAQPGDATWLHRFFNTETWATMGGDFNPTPSASIFVGALGSYTWGSTSGMVADVQSWIDNPASNFGWVIIGNETVNGSAKQFASRESAANPPQLSVTFLLTAVEDDDPEIPADFSLAQNYPNPFNPSTVIEYSLPQASEATLEIFNVLGQKVRTLAHGQQPAGRHRVQWDGKNDTGELLPSAIYLYRLQAGGRVETRKMLFVR
jgi:hypothetical protein